MSNSHLSREVACPGCGVQYTFQDGEKEKVCTWCRNIVRAPEPQVDFREVESLLAEGDKLCNALEFREAWYYYRRAKEMDPSCVKAYWGLIRALYGVQIVFEDKTETRYVLSTVRVPQDIEQSEEWHALREKMKGQPRELTDEYTAFVKNIRAQQQNMKNLWNRGWKGEYDIYLCYKETERYEDPMTRKVRNRPSKDQEWVRAFYEELDRQNRERKEPFRIFYAPVTLADAAGDPYAAHLSHALLTSRVMLLMGTQPEYFDTSWVLGERTRFHHYMEEENYTRKIIPVSNRLLTGGRSFEEVIPKDCTDIQGIDVAKDMEKAVRTVLAKCADILTQDRGKQPGPCQHAVLERDYEVVCGEKNQLARAVEEKENILEETLRDKGKLEREKEASALKLREALDRKTELEAECREKNKTIDEKDRQIFQTDVALEREKKETEWLREQNRELQAQNRELQAQKAADKVAIENKDLEIKGLNFKINLLEEQMRKQPAQTVPVVIQQPVIQQVPEQKPVLVTPPAPPAPEKHFRCRDQYGFRVSNDPNGVKSYGSDLRTMRTDELRYLSKIDQIYVSVMAKDKNVTLKGRLEGMSGRYSEEAAVTVPRNMARDICFGLGNIPLSQFSGDFTLTLTDQHGGTLQKTLNLKGR